MNNNDLEEKVLKGQQKRSHRELFIVAAILLLAAIAAGAAYYYTYKNYVIIGNKIYDRDITEITLSGSDIEDYSVLCRFYNLQSADLRGQDITAEQYDEISAMLDDVKIEWLVPINGCKYDCLTENFLITPDIAADQLQYLKYLTKLKHVDSEYYPLCDELYEIRERIVSDSDGTFVCKAKIYDIEIDDTTAELVLNNIQITDLTDLHNAIRFFPNIKKFEMCECGLSDETMGSLRNQYPDVNFVWTVKFLHYTVRTDALVFSTLVDVGDSFDGTQEDFSPLFRYCTELRALDLGHHYITDISEIVNLKHLQVLILADNRIEDISPLAELKELHYLELFSNRFTDVSPLTKLENLQDLNICFNRRITNPTELTKCSKLNRLYISGCSLSQWEKNTLINGLPYGCELNTDAENAVKSGWRDNRKNAAIRRTFYRWQKVTEYQDWAHVTYAS